MHTNAYETLECIRNAYENYNRERREMEEKWKPHPTRANIFISLEDGLMYERLSSGWHNMLPNQKMTELQEIESFRKASGLVAMTSRSRGRIPQPSDKTLSKESE